LIFDEPFSGFDPINANIIKEQILSLKEKGTSIIFSTHRMESVEELCEYIALIHKSEKILDGKLSDIKKAYKNNIFEIGLETSNQEALLLEMKDKFQIITQDYDSLENQLNLRVQLPSNQSGEILSFLGSRANVNGFIETIPSANDIFIKTIQNKNIDNE